MAPVPSMAPLISHLLVPRRGGGHGGGGGVHGGSSGDDGDYSGNDLSPGQKAGIVIGVMGGLFVIGVIYAAWQTYQERNKPVNEKLSFGRKIWRVFLFATGLWVVWLLYWLVSGKACSSKRGDREATSLRNAISEGWAKGKAEKARRQAEEQVQKQAPHVSVQPVPQQPMPTQQFMPPQQFPYVQQPVQAGMGHPQYQYQPQYR